MKIGTLRVLEMRTDGERGKFDERNWMCVRMCCCCCIHTVNRCAQQVGVAA